MENHIEQPQTRTGNVGRQSRMNENQDCRVLMAFLAALVILWQQGLYAECARASPPYPVPDEQRLYRDLMYGYESSVRPVLNASQTIVIDFRLSLNQIVDLDERKQVLTTNAFIDQEWQDDKLKWEPEDYNGIKTLRVPADFVWLPDTFVFNNADNGATGFMQGVYVVLDSNGTVLWPVPVKLKSSCKVDIKYFPFDDQKCILRFGSWVYSAQWMDFTSSLEDINMDHYIDNSEWDLLAIQFEKSVRKYACCPEPHPDLTYILHMRRRTFYYIFNIIVPCIMLSVLTLLTFWLPTTSGEKISLGLSVFLAFSMFMLLIAEEVPSTSESVPLIGIYLTTVMTMTSVSVVMSVMVINLYNRGYRAQKAPSWLRILILRWLCKMLRMRHDIEQLALTIRLEEEEEYKYACQLHGIYPRRRSMLRSPRPSLILSPDGSHVVSPGSTPLDPQSPKRSRSFEKDSGEPEIERNGYHPRKNGYKDDSSDSLKEKCTCDGDFENETDGNDKSKSDQGNISDVCGNEKDTQHGSSDNANHKDKNGYLSSDSKAAKVITGERNGETHKSSTNTDSRNNSSRNGLRQQATRQICRDKMSPYESGTNSFVKYPDINLSDHVTASDMTLMEEDTEVVQGDRTSTSHGSYDDDSDGPVWRKRNSLRRSHTSDAILASGELDLLQTMETNVDEALMQMKTGTNHKFFSQQLHPNTHAGSNGRILLTPQSRDISSGSMLSDCNPDMRDTVPIVNSDDGLSAEPKAKRMRKGAEPDCNKKRALRLRREIIVEWQTMAMVIDRLLFWIFLVATIVAYIAILLVVPRANRPKHPEDSLPIRILTSR